MKEESRMGGPVGDWPRMVTLQWMSRIKDALHTDTRLLMFWISMERWGKILP